MWPKGYIYRWRKCNSGAAGRARIHVVAKIIEEIKIIKKKKKNNK